MTVQEFLKDTKFMPESGYFFSRDGSTMVAMIRGWGELQHLFETEQEAANFQDEVGKFIADAINEKLNQ